MENISIINKVESSLEITSNLENWGDFFLTPGRLFFGREYKRVDDKLLAEEEFFSVKETLLKVSVVALFVFSIPSSLIGYLLKYIAIKHDPSLTEKYQGKKYINHRNTEDMKQGRLPQSPLTPNCVNSDQSSLYGDLYNVEPISIDDSITSPIDALKKTIAKVEVDGANVELETELVQETDNYLHYEFTINVKLAGAVRRFTDDVDFFYDEKQKHFKARSASRVGIRDAVHLDFNQPGANKKRIEKIREFFTSSN
ncbi:MAG: hypothetical protein S4CHLAM7_07690 [Chlamydiae bacterium]|nr:hypothetical protein [Chlamydiota bacterium]